MTASITGYRTLSEREIERINAIKALAGLTGRIIEDLIDEPETDQRWLAIASTDLQQGFLALVSAVAKPESF